MNEYFKWVIILFILRVIVENMLQAVVFKQGFIVCVTDPDDINPRAKGHEWNLEDRRGNGVIKLSVIITLMTVNLVTSTLYSKFVFLGEFGPEHQTIV